MNNEPPKFAHSLYEKSLLTMILVLALRSSVQDDVQIKKKKKKHVVMDDIFIYIREHLTEDISLERLENEFYVSRYHIAVSYTHLDVYKRQQLFHLLFCRSQSLDFSILLYLVGNTDLKNQGSGSDKKADETTDLQRGHFFDIFFNTSWIAFWLSDCKMRF